MGWRPDIGIQFSSAVQLGNFALCNTASAGDPPLDAEACELDWAMACAKAVSVACALAVAVA